MLSHIEFILEACQSIESEIENKLFTLTQGNVPCVQGIKLVCRLSLIFANIIQE